MANDVGSKRNLPATSRPTLLEPLESPGGLGTSFDLRVDLVEVGCGKHAQIAARRHRGGVLGRGEAHGGRVAGDGRLLDIVRSLGTGEEALVTDDGVNVGGGTLGQVEEGASVDVGLLEVDVDALAVGLCGGMEVCLGPRSSGPCGSCPRARSWCRAS